VPRHHSPNADREVEMRAPKTDSLPQKFTQENAFLKPGKNRKNKNCAYSASFLRSMLVRENNHNSEETGTLKKEGKWRRS